MVCKHGTKGKGLGLGLDMGMGLGRGVAVHLKMGFAAHLSPTIYPHNIHYQGGVP